MAQFPRPRPYNIEFRDDIGRSEDLDLSEFIISPFSEHMFGTMSGVRHMASRPRRRIACHCRGLQTCVHCSVSLLPEFASELNSLELFSNPNPLQVMEGPPMPAKSRISTFKCDGDLGECSICQDRIKKGQMICRLPCQDTVSHAFHRDCVKPWLEKNNTCPNCRSKI